MMFVEDMFLVTRAVYIKSLHSHVLAIGKVLKRNNGCYHGLTL